MRTGRQGRDKPLSAATGHVVRELGRCFGPLRPLRVGQTGASSYRALTVPLLGGSRDGGAQKEPVGLLKGFPASRRAAERTPPRTVLAAGEGHGGAPTPSPANDGYRHWHNPRFKQAGTTPGQKGLLEEGMHINSRRQANRKIEEERSVFLFSPRGGTLEH